MVGGTGETNMNMFHILSLKILQHSQENYAKKQVPE